MDRGSFAIIGRVYKIKRQNEKFTITCPFCRKRTRDAFERPVFYGGNLFRNHHRGRWERCYNCNSWFYIPRSEEESLTVAEQQQMRDWKAEVEEMAARNGHAIFPEDWVGSRFTQNTHAQCRNCGVGVSITFRPMDLGSNKRTKEIEQPCPKPREWEVNSRADEKPRNTRSRKADPNPARKCLCGCGSDTPRGSRFKPGHDGKLHGWINTARTDTAMAAWLEDKPEYVQKEIQEYLQKKGWTLARLGE